MQFKVKALKPGAGVSVLAIDAADAADAGRQASTQGYAVLSVVREGGARRVVRSRFPLLLFNQELLALLESGVSVIEALETLAEKEQRPAVRNVLGQLVARLKEGRTLSSALHEHVDAFPPLYVATIRASEKTSDLEQALGRYIAYQTQLESVRSKLVNAAIYPALLIAVGGLVVLFLLGYVVPRFSHIYEDIGTNLPWMSRLLLAWGTMLERHGLVIFAVFAAVVATGVWALRQPAVSAWLGNALWRIPVVGERLRVLELARFYRTLGMLQRGGLAIVPALDMVAGMLSPMLRPQLERAMQRVREGSPISQAMDANGLTTHVASRMLRVGERAGNIGDMMERIAVFHDDEIARWAEWFTRLFGPLLMLAIGLVIGIIVVLMYLPIFQLAESLQ